MHHLVPDIVTLLRRPFGTQVKRGLNKQIVHQVGKEDFYFVLRISWHSNGFATK